MEKNYLTQSEIASTELIYSQAVTAFEEANKNMAKAVEKLINTPRSMKQTQLKMVYWIPVTMAMSWVVPGCSVLLATAILNWFGTTSSAP